jgi:hypothetical protein
MDAICSSATSVSFQRTTLHHIPEYGSIQNRRPENLISYSTEDWRKEVMFSETLWAPCRSRLAQNWVTMRGWSSCNRTLRITSRECQETLFMFTCLQQLTKKLELQPTLLAEYKHLAPNSTVPHKVSRVTPLQFQTHSANPFDTWDVTNLFIKYLQLLSIEIRQRIWFLVECDMQKIAWGSAGKSRWFLTLPLSIILSQLS